MAGNVLADRLEIGKGLLLEYAQRRITHFDRSHNLRGDKPSADQQRN
jgi:hypothetical protein